ncbi:MAG: phosphatidate cytidylyltransferase [Clostridia bacterium]|nr:phosphatidate cytidylyltransferase [Clostridia bacterium]
MNIKRILTTLIGFPLVTLIIIYGNKYLMDCLIGIIACIAIHEYFKLDKNSELKKISWVGYLIAIMISLIHIVNIKVSLIVLLFGLPTVLLILFLHIVLTDMKINIKDIAFAFLGICYIVSFVIFIPLIYGIGDNTELSFTQNNTLIEEIMVNFKNIEVTGKFLIWYLVWCSWGSDVFAYIIGKHFGKHKFSKISPNKTIEGCFAGIVGAIILSLVYTYAINEAQGFNLNYLSIGIMSFILCIIGQIGDFSASTIKRYFDVKDFSNIFPGHGGMLDRMDSVMFIAPYAFLTFTFIL